MSASFPLRGEGWERGSVRTFDDHLFLQFRVALCGRWGLIYKPPQKNSRAENDATSPTIVRLVEFSLGQIKLMDFFVWLGLSRGGRAACCEPAKRLRMQGQRPITHTVSIAHGPAFWVLSFE